MAETAKQAEAVSAKPCRACTDFKKWTKAGGPTGPGLAPTATTSAAPHIPPEEQDRSLTDHQQGLCPPDRQELGSSTWSLLHSLAAYYPDRPSPRQQAEASLFLTLFSRLYPCKECAEDLRADLVESPPKVTSSKEFSEWMCQLHNKVNVKLGKPTFDCSKVFERWRDGWKDGSCD